MIDLHVDEARGTKSVVKDSTVLENAFTDAAGKLWALVVFF